jgi:hypothetical protein
LGINRNRSLSGAITSAQKNQIEPYRRDKENAPLSKAAHFLYLFLFFGTYQS